MTIRSGSAVIKDHTKNCILSFLIYENLKLFKITDNFKKIIGAGSPFKSIPLEINIDAVMKY